MFPFPTMKLSRACRIKLNGMALWCRHV